MKLFCISTRLSEEQAQKIWAQSPQFFNVRDFYITVGQEYWVYGINIKGGEPWVYIQPLSGYLRPAPLCLFNIIDRRMSKYWMASLDLEGNLEISYPTIINNPYYIDNLSDSKPEIVKDFQEIEELVKIECQEQK